VNGRRGGVARPAGATGPKTSGTGVALARALSKWGVCSRSQATDLVRGGTVKVGPIVVRDPNRRIDMDRDRVTVAGKPVRAAQLVHLMLNKPRGVVTTAADEQGRSTVYTLLGDAELPWVGPVGRLDRASEGLLLLTNDTRWAAALLAPASHVDKCYHVQIDRVPDAQLCARLVRGSTRGSSSTDPGADGVTDDVGRAKAARILRTGDRHGWLEIVLDEGKNRQIRRLLSACDVQVLRLVRVALGPLALGDLAKGAWRHLTPGEVAALTTAAGRTASAPGSPAPARATRSAPRSRSNRT
jgi:23S rRNA pseudouridine2605 synthase